MIEKTLHLETTDGEMSTFVTHPEAPGAYPVVILYMDAPGIREELRDFARRIASVGYYCMLPSLYYRDGDATFPTADKRTEAETLKMRMLMDALTNARVVADTRALLAAIDEDPAARQGALGCIGYCMSGRYVLTLAGTFPERFRACVAMHGVGMLTDQPDSPHKLIPKLQGGHYWGFAEVDEHVPLDEVAALREAVAQAGLSKAVHIEVQPETQHGFVFPQRTIYHRAEAERYWERTFALFKEQLG